MRANSAGTGGGHRVVVTAATRRSTVLNLLDPATVALTRAVAGQYVLQHELGRGGMGVVFLARDEQLDRLVAIKTLPQHLAADAQVRDRFLREARTAAALSHQNIVPIYSAAERDDIVYFAMRYVPGQSLAEHLAATGPLGANDAVAILRQLASALAYAHACGVVHRDIKAENVLLDSETGRAMLTDFGIARLVESQPHTATGTVLGTVQYMSPEQVSGDTLDGRSDLYALGVLAFLMLTGHFPFERNSASAVLIAHVNSPAPRLGDAAPHVSAALGDIVDRLLSKSREARFENGEAVRAALDALPAEVTTVAPVAAPEQLSSTQAQEVWARAAELQANTGVYVPPAAFSPRVPAMELVTQGYDAATVRESAVDAGIDAKYVERALAEHANASVALAPLEVQHGELMRKRPNPWFGARTKLEFTAAFNGELDAEAFEDVADEVRQVLGELTTVSAVGRTLTINTGGSMSRQGCGMSRMMQQHLSSRNGRTQARAFEDLSQTAGAFFAGMGLGGGVGMSMLAAGITMGLTHFPPGAMAVFVGGLCTSNALARVLFMRASHKKERELDALLQRVIARARRSMLEQEARKRLPRATSVPPT